MGKDGRNISRREFMRQAGIGAAALAVASSTPLKGALASTVKNGMAYRRLGRTGLEISEITIGCGGINPSKANILRAALAQGINYIDTSSGYGKGQSEFAIGEAVKAMGIRDKVFIATKATGVRHGPLINAPASVVEKAVRENLEGSLKRLQSDYIDVYFVPHGAVNVSEVGYPGLKECLEKLKKEGKIRFTGVSTHTNYVDISMATIKDGYYDVLMSVISSSTLVPKIGEIVKNSYFDKTQLRRRGKKGSKGRSVLDMRDVLKEAKASGIGLVAMKAANKAYTPENVHEIVKGELAKDTNMSFHQVAYRFVLDLPQLSAVTVGMSSMTHVDEALAVLQQSLS